MERTSRTELNRARTERKRVRLAAERVARLSRPGTPERLFTLIEVSEETGISTDKIVTALVGQKNPQ